ncbi:MAG: DUF2834 domain-containing protein [Candidatus Eisenbacteria bacterium]|uniref:DUF2834 domain-containing protein n=1 Tax=Eiseniibacteriota bacterium TaxID=2212470 RepID=A0A956N9V0_UNCEI|nr:DUF2834 domain-containing protein [Candidatus Eisenbacteria bacterium]MCB9465819.1 DUF2834 domain-containing protein [Candidatus Eisenbacteria bacterium]
MSAISVYAILTGLGAILPLTQFLPWIAEHGFDLGGFARELFSTRVGAFFGLDVIVAAIVTIAFVLIDGRRKRVPVRWVPIAATCLVGVSCGLPLYLWIREHARRRALAHPPRHYGPR